MTGSSPSGSPTAGASSPLTVDELILNYWLFARRHYQRDGLSTRELDNIRDTLQPVRELCGQSPCAGFGSLALKAVRQRTIDNGLARTMINFRISKVRRGFMWAAENEVVAPEVYQNLMTVKGLLRGRDGVRKTDPVKTVPEVHVVALLPYVSKPVRVMIEVQSLTGMGPGEVMAMRGADIGRSGDVWVYRPAGHKTQNHGHERVILLGPRDQAGVRPWLGEDPAEYLFRPADAVAVRNAERRRRRKTPMTTQATTTFPL